MKKQEPRIQKQPECQPPKPLWRFGWAGWTLLPVAISLAAVLFSGVDGRDHTLRAIQWAFGNDAMDAFVTLWLTFHCSNLGLSPFAPPPEAQFGLLTLCLTLIGMGIHPGRFRPWAYPLIGALGLTLPPMVLKLGILLQSTVFPTASWDSWQSVARQGIAFFAGALVAAAVLSCITRSWTVFLFLILTGALGAWLRAETWMTYSGGDLLLGQQALLYEVALRWAWNPGLFAILLWWAIRARRRWKPDWACQSCGYDLRGCNADLCPECGTPHTPLRAPSASSE